MKKQILLNHESLENFDSVTITSELESILSGSGNLTSGVVANIYPSEFQKFNYRVNPYAIGEGLGLSVKYDVRGNFIIKDFMISVYAEVSKITAHTCTYVAGVQIKRNDEIFAEAPLAPLTGEYVIDANWNPLGKITLPVPTTGKVTISLITGQNFNTGIGIVPTNNTEIIFTNY